MGNSRSQLFLLLVIPIHTTFQDANTVASVCLLEFLGTWLPILAQLLLGGCPVLSRGGALTEDGRAKLIAAASERAQHAASIRQTCVQSRARFLMRLLMLVKSFS